MKLAIRLAALAGLGFGMLALSSSTAFATQARIDSMGGGVKLWTIDDDANIFDFPALLVMYGDMAHIDNITMAVDGDGNPTYPNMRFGYHGQLGDDMVLAVYGGVISASTRGIGDGFDAGGNAFTGGSSLGVGAQASAAPHGGPEGGPSSLGMQGGDAANNVDLKIGLLYALRIGDSIRLGLMLNILRDNGDLEAPEGGGILEDRGAWLADLALGFGLDMEGLEMDLTLGFEFGGFEDAREDEARDPSGDPVTFNGVQVWNQDVDHWAVDTHFAFRLNGRFLIDFFGNSKMVPYLRAAYGTQEVTNVRPFTDGGQPNTRIENGTWNAFDFTIGTDVRIEPFQDIVISPGLGFRVVSQTREGVFTDTGPTGFPQDFITTDRDGDLFVSAPFYGVAVDVKIWDYLDFRFGASQHVNFHEKKQTGPDGVTAEQNYSEVRTNIATGLGFNFPIYESMLTIDININPLHWLQGPAFITGSSTFAFGNEDGWGLSGAIQYDW